MYRTQILGVALLWFSREAPSPSSWASHGARPTGVHRAARSIKSSAPFPTPSLSSLTTAQRQRTEAFENSRDPPEWRSHRKEGPRSGVTGWNSSCPPTRNTHRSSYQQASTSADCGTVCDQHTPRTTLCAAWGSRA